MRISGLMVAGAISAHLLAASEGAAKRAEPATASATSTGLVSEAAREAIEARKGATQPEQTSGEFQASRREGHANATAGICRHNRP